MSKSTWTCPITVSGLMVKNGSHADKYYKHPIKCYYYNKIWELHFIVTCTTNQERERGEVFQKQHTAAMQSICLYIHVHVQTG